MRKLIAAISILFLVSICLSWTGYEAFLGTAVDVNATVTKTNGVGFTSNEIILIGKPAAVVGMAFVFSRAAGSASTVDFAFEVSWDGAKTWGTLDGGTVQIATNTAAVTGTTVRVFKEINLYGVSNIRLKSIYNSDGANNVTGVSVYISY